ncbi:ornithine decarboxylase [Gigaspora margarita]|uniref:ornithine decarboxylase n=1 Tax=Gigaspora margarita TaxID=4874 RepID=A0A8H4A092_GIGMA|nr:ornithine decarboxylase [Gigaspora margarita]
MNDIGTTTFHDVKQYSPKSPSRQLSSKYKSYYQADLPTISMISVKDALKNQILSLDIDMCEPDAENAFFVANLDEVYNQHFRWKSLLPRIEPFYAVKCNPDPLLLRLLASLGTGFDCASKVEIQTILDIGVDPSKIIYANPCKQASFVRYAAEHNVKMMTFDNSDELYKIKRYFPDAQLVLRILTDDTMSLCKLGLKFGASLDSTEALLQTARKLDLNVIGVSFHVGSGCYDENAFIDAVHRARFVFDQASELGFNLHLLDVGGGFSHSRNCDGITFEKIAAILGPEIDSLFPPNVRVIAEPGRYYAAPAFTIATHIIARRTVLSNGDVQTLDMDTVLNDETQTRDDHSGYMYYINDGVYGAFNCILFDHQVVHPKVLFKKGIFTFDEILDEPVYNCSIWGPTCDSIDCISTVSSLPVLLPGDWLYFEEMGAYTICAASQFNGFKKSNIIYTATNPEVLAILYDAYF